ENDRHVAAGPVEMRLDHLQREGGRDRGVEGVAALFQHRHTDGGADPVGRGDHPQRALDLPPRGERIGIDVFHARSASWKTQLITAREANQPTEARFYSLVT